MALEFPSIDPVVVQIGPVAIHWYALSYLAGFLCAWGIMKYLSRLDTARPNGEDVDDYMTWAILAVLLGGRLGYILFYNLEHYLSSPGDILKLWQGGMAFHGGLIGVVSSIVIYALVKKIPVLRLADICSAAAPVGFFFGRIANFVNGELYGRVTDGPWGMVFPRGGPEPRHPSQLYEALLEGLVLFLVVFFMARNDKIRNRPGLISAAFLGGYGLFRFIIEYVRQPDDQLGLYFGFISMGQMLCIPMLLASALLIVLAYRKQPHEQPA